MMSELLPQLKRLLTKVLSFTGGLPEETAGLKLIGGVLRVLWVLLSTFLLEWQQSPNPFPFPARGTKELRVSIVYAYMLIEQRYS